MGILTTPLLGVTGHNMLNSIGFFCRLFFKSFCFIWTYFMFLVFCLFSFLFFNGFVCVCFLLSGNCLFLKKERQSNRNLDGHGLRKNVEGMEMENMIKTYCMVFLNKKNVCCIYVIFETKCYNTPVED